MIRWRPISLWCLEATISGITCRVWMSADGSGWHAWHEREVRHQSKALPNEGPPERIVFSKPRAAMRAARIEVERVLAFDAAGAGRRRRGAQSK